mmetsp:Transcript_69246/g.192833  ORF Transcript_69246/g.192833 Transcript_69246/m.192833 type:complete len:208 (-) Transcript_69246:203-826(-)
MGKTAAKKCPATGKKVKADRTKSKKNARHAQLKKKADDAAWWETESGKEKRTAVLLAEAALRGDAGNNLPPVQSTVGAEDRAAGEKFVSFLGRAKTLRKAEEALEQVLYADPSPETLGVVLGHCAARGLANCVRALIDRGALLDVQDPSEPSGKSTPLQLAASRGQVNAVRLLVAAGADRTGALEASQGLSRIFEEEQRAIQKALRA